MRTQRDRLGQDLNEKLAEERKRRRALEEQNAEIQTSNRRSGRRGFMDLEKMKTEDPERYEQLMKRRQEMAQRMQEQQRRRQEVVAKLDTQSMTPERRAQIERYQELTKQAEQMRANMENLTPEERMEQMRANRDQFREMMELTNVVRDEAIDQAVRSGDTEAVKETMQLFSGPGGGGGGRGPRGGGNNGAPPPRGGF